MIYCMPWLSGNHVSHWKKAYQFSESGKKVCSERVDRAEETRKRHTRESKQGKKYARGAPTGREKHKKDVQKTKNRNITQWEIFQTKICQNKHSNCEL